MTKSDSTTTKDASTTLVSYYNPTHVFPFLFVASVALMVQASQHCIDRNKRWDFDKERCTNEWAFAVTVGTVSTVFLLILIMLNKVTPNAADAIRPYLAVFLVLWWFVATCVLTFDAPYTNTGNGFFACWVGFIAASLRAADCCASFKLYANDAGTKMLGSPVAPLLLSSAVVLVVACISCEKRAHCEKEFGYAVALGVISIVFCGLSIISPQFNKALSAFLFVWWIPGVYILTFSDYDARFYTTGNGYFAAWGSLIFATGFFMSVWLQETELSLPVTAPGPKTTGP